MDKLRESLIKLLQSPAAQDLGFTFATDAGEPHGSGDVELVFAEEDFMLTIGEI